MRIIIAIVAFVATMGAFFISGSFHSATTPKSSDITAAINSPSTSTASHPKTASVLSGIKTFIDFSPAISSPQNSPSATPPSTNGLTLPLLQRITPTPIPSSLHTSTPTPSSQSQTASTPSPSSQSTPSPSPSTSSGLPLVATPSVTPSLTPTPDPTNSPQATPTPTPAPESNYSISLIYFTSPISRGNIAEVKIQTIASAQCSILVTLPSNSTSHASGIWDSTNETPLIKMVPADGILDWQWRISGSTKISPPDATIELKCSINGNTYSSSLQMIITQ